jgi:hypothetical protein
MRAAMHKTKGNDFSRHRCFAQYRVTDRPPFPITRHPLPRHLNINISALAWYISDRLLLSALDFIKGKNSQSN